MVTLKLIAANSPDYYCPNASWGGLKTEWKKRKKTGLVLPGVGEVEPGEGWSPRM